MFLGNHSGRQLLLSCTSDQVIRCWRSLPVTNILFPFPYHHPIMACFKVKDKQQAKERCFANRKVIWRWGAKEGEIKRTLWCACVNFPWWMWALLLQSRTNEKLRTCFENLTHTALWKRTMKLLRTTQPPEGLEKTFNFCVPIPGGMRSIRQGCKGWKSGDGGR